MTRTFPFALGLALLVACGGGSDSNFGTITVAPGFSPDPTTGQGTAGGMRDASTLGAGCNGWIANTPDHLLVTSGDFANLRIMAFGTEDGADTTLVVEKPDGSYLCNDDSDGLHPMVEGPMPAGTYKVWVGSYTEGQNSAYRLGVSELATTTPSALAGS